MKIATTFLCLSLAATAGFAKDINTKNSEAEQVGYSFGYLIGRTNADSLQGIDLDAFTQGLKTAAAGQKSTLSDEEMARVLTQFKRQTEAKELQALKKIADQNKVKGQAFLAENAKKAGVKTTKSGLQYVVLKEGSGKVPKASSTVQVHYEGRLIDDTIFDSSIARDQPAEFKASQVIQGWTEGLQLMKEGAKYRFFIPSELAYGQIGSGDVIEPNSTLIFDVELLKVTQ